MLCYTSIVCHFVTLQVNRSDVDGYGGNVQNDIDWSRNDFDIAYYFLDSTGKNC